MRKIIVIILILLLVSGTLLFLGKHYLLKEVKILLQKKVEETGHGITIEDIGYSPVKGIGLKDVNIYTDTHYKEKQLFIPALYHKQLLWFEL